jgi:hypothetical protein
MVDVAPTFTLETIGKSLPTLVDAVAEALGLTADESPLVISGADEASDRRSVPAQRVIADGPTVQTLRQRASDGGLVV